MEIFSLTKDALLALLPILCVYAVIQMWRSWAQLRRITKRVNMLPGPKAHWLFGNLDKHPGPCEKGTLYSIGLANKYGPTYRFLFSHIRPTVVVCHPDSIKELVKASSNKESSGRGAYSFIRPWLGDGLLISNGPMWHRNRKLLTPAFHFDVLKPYLKIYNDASDIMLNKLITEAKTGQSVEIFTPVSLCALDVVLRCAFSFEDDIQYKGTNHPYVIAVSSLAKIIIKRFFNALLHFKMIFHLTPSSRTFYAACDYVHKVADDVIQKRKATLKSDPEQSQKRYRDFLDILLLAKDDSGKGLTDLEIRQEVDTFLFEGHDTTASAISWCLYHLAKYPVHQDKARAEVDEVLNGKDITDIEWDDLKSFPYLTMCIKESMRMVPPVPFVAREMIRPAVIGGVELLTKTSVDLHIFALHHNVKVWGEDHMEYRPERFTPENMEKMDSYAFLPFSAGSRNCIGQNFAMHELKVVVGKVLHRCILRMDGSHQVEQVSEMITRSRDGIKLFMDLRHA